MARTLLLTATGVGMATAQQPLPPSVVAARAEAAVIGSFVADAAAMPLHWIYDTNQIAQMVGSGEPEFYNPPSCPFYSYQAGMNTPYGQQNVAYLSVGAATGAFAPTDVEAAYYKTWGPGGPAQPGGWYFDKSTKEFVANEGAGQHWPSCGGNDNQADAIAHMIAIVALYAGNTSAVLEAGDAVIRVTQNTDDAVAFGLAFARIFEKVLYFNASGLEAVNATIADLSNPARLHPMAQDGVLALGLVDALNNLGMTNLDYCLRVGQSCDYPFNLWTGSHLVAQLGSSSADFVSGVRQTILAGGDSGSRSMFVGAVQAARMGSADFIPAAWSAGTSAYATVAPLAAQLVAHRMQQ